MVLNQVKTGKNAIKGKNVNLLKNSRKKFGKNRKKLSKKWLKILWTSSLKSWSKVLLKNKKKIWRIQKLMKSLTRFKRINLSKLNLQLLIQMLSAMAVELLLLLVQDTSVAFAKTLIIVKIASRINNILTHFWKSKILLKFQKLCSLWLMRACQTLKQILNKMLTRIMILQNFSEVHRISKLRVETANSIQITTTIDVTTSNGFKRFNRPQEPFAAFQGRGVRLDQANEAAGNPY